MKAGNKSNFVESYNQLLQNMVTLKKSVKDFSRENLSMKMEYAKTKLHDLESISKHDLEIITQHFHKDLSAASNHYFKTKKDIKNWFIKDFELTEDKLLRLFANVVDQSRVELQQMENKLHEWHSGEVTSIGTLECKNCGEKITFTESQIINNCRKCDGDLFHKNIDFI